MRILVDGDACPVKEDIVAIAQERDIEVIFVVSTASYFRRDWNVKQIIVDSLQFLNDLALATDSDIVGLEAFLDIHAEIPLGQVTDMAHRGLHDVAGVKVPAQCACLGG